MKLTSALAFLAAGVVTTATSTEFQKVHQRDLAQVENIVTKVRDGLRAFDAKVEEFNGGDPSNLSAAAKTMIEIVKKAVKALGPVTNVTIEEAPNFKDLSDQMNAAGDKLLNDLESKVPLFKEEHICQFVYDGVKELSEAVHELTTTVASKFPNPDVSKDEIAHFVQRFKEILEKLKECSEVTPAGDDCPPEPPIPEPYPAPVDPEHHCDLSKPGPCDPPKPKPDPEHPSKPDPEHHCDPSKPGPCTPPSKPGPSDPSGKPGPSDPSGKPGPSDPSGKPGPSDPSGKPGPSDPSGKPGPSDPSGKPGPSDPSGHEGPSDPSGKPGPSDPSAKPPAPVGPSDPPTKPSTGSKPGDPGRPVVQTAGVAAVGVSAGALVMAVAALLF